MSAASISKIHVTNSTGLSLNERFTAISSVPEPQGNVHRRSRSRSRSRSRPRSLPPVDRQSSLANRRLLHQLAKRHKIQAALKLKRRSLRSAGGNIAMKRGSIKALRVAPNGRPIRTNSLTKIATMKADLIANGSSRNSRTLRRANSVSTVTGRLGSRRPLMGGAAQRVTKRRLQRLNSDSNGQQSRISRPIGGAVRRGRSRSRSRVRGSEMAVAQAANVRARPQSRGRSQSRGRMTNVRGRSRSRSRNGRGRNDVGATAASLPIKARLGRRPGGQNAAVDERHNRRGGRIRRPSISRRGVAQGRVQKRRNSTASGIGGSGAVQQQRVGSAGGRAGRTRGRSTGRNVVGRSNSRIGTRNTRNAAVVGQQKSGLAVQGRRRGRSQQRNSGRGGAPQRNGKGGGQQEAQQRRGRSRSRGTRGGRGGRILGKGARPQVNKDALDKELDQYMATTKTENDMDYLLKN